MRTSLAGASLVWCVAFVGTACGPTPIVVNLEKDAGPAGGSSSTANSSGPGGSSNAASSGGASSSVGLSSSRGTTSSGGRSSSSRASSSRGGTSSAGSSSSSPSSSSSSGGIGSSGGAQFCYELDEDTCLQFPQCDVAPGCCPGDPNQCTGLGDVVACPDFCPPPACTSLNEDSCRHTQGCVADYCFQCSCDGVFQGCRATTGGRSPCPALGCPQPQCQCNTLDERGCLAAGNQCHAQYCTVCDPQPSFLGCYGPNEDPGCPVVDCAQSCRANEDCAGNGIGCVPPDAPQTCGICYDPPDTCTSDAECAPGDACLPVVCACNGQHECRPGCNSPNAPDCAEGTVCNAAGHCVVPPCTAGSCSWNFVCGVDGTCQRRACDTELLCRGGVCVDGRCFDQAGYCGFPVP